MLLPLYFCDEKVLLIQLKEEEEKKGGGGERISRNSTTSSSKGKRKKKKKRKISSCCHHMDVGPFSRVGLDYPERVSPHSIILVESLRPGYGSKFLSLKSQFTKS